VIVSEAIASERFFNYFAEFRESYRKNSTKIQTAIRARVAIIDTGLSPWMQINVDDAHRRSWVGDEKDTDDPHGHGSYCAHFLSSIAPDAQIYVAKVFSKEKFGLDEMRNIPAASIIWIT
jgi:hypothetical protein